MPLLMALHCTMHCPLPVAPFLLLAPRCLAGLHEHDLSWLAEATLSDDESSDDEAWECTESLRATLVPAHDLSTCLWDLCTRPAGMSVSSLLRLYCQRTGCRIDDSSAAVALNSPALSLFKPWVVAGEDRRECKAWWVRRQLPSADSDFWSYPCATAQRYVEVASPRLAAALADERRSHVIACDRLDQLPLLFAPAGGVVLETRRAALAPAAFSHRQYDRRPDAESLRTPPTTPNRPLTTFEFEPPLDVPMRTASDVGEILFAKPLARLHRHERRSQRMWRLAALGQYASARAAKPPDLQLNVRRSTRVAFRGVPMDLTSQPFRSLQPSRWPSRPPPGDLRIARIRREFRDHPDFTDRGLRSMLSHGNPSHGASITNVIHLAGPHMGPLKHFQHWWPLVQKDVEKGWARTSFPAVVGYWPLTVHPSGVVLQKGSWRRTDDMSWPPPPIDEESSRRNPAGVLAHNAMQFEVPFMVFVFIAMLTAAAATMLVAGVEVLLHYIDLRSAYKRTGQQLATLNMRLYSTPMGQQVNDTICFGQGDGPSSFSRQSGWMSFVMRRELTYADACHPTRCAAILAWQQMRLGSEGADASWAALFVLIVFIDDFGAASFNDLLWRLDGSPVLLADGSQRRRAFLHHEVKAFVVARFGHDSGVDKEAWPAPCLVLLGLGIDLVAEVKRLDSEKRERYAEAIAALVLNGRIGRARLLSLAFKLLVVCEVRPDARQWLHSIFRLLRRVDSAGLPCRIFYVSADALDDGSKEAAGDMLHFRELLKSADDITVPLASRSIFPLENDPSVLVKFDDASGRQAEHLMQEADGTPGFGGCAVRRGDLFYMHGEWDTEELDALHISVLEAHQLFMSTFTLLDAVDSDVAYCIEFNDNVGAEFSAAREVPHAELMQRVIAQRSRMLRERNVFVLTERVPSATNEWADHLSRGRVSIVLQQAAALGLRCIRLTPSDDVRSTAYLRRSA
jgi:hypothetical protein